MEKLLANSTMNRTATLSIAILLIGLAFWQLSTDHPFAPPWLAATLLLLISGLTGVRVGTDHATRYVEDLERTNRYLADENDQLKELNLNYLKQLEPDDVKNDV